MKQLYNSKHLNLVKSLQIVAFDNPNPPDYGGAVEIFYKLEAFHSLGVKIDLHLFTYGERKDYTLLDEFCEQIYFYKRNMSASSLLSSKPFIVKSRETPELLENLSQKQSPILFEGIHCCAYLHRKELSNHFKIVRMHNVEHDYYEGLSRASSNILKKKYFQSEAQKLKKFEAQLTHANQILAITEKDANHFQAYSKTLWIPPFGKPFLKVDSTEEYVLFHGNLSVAENYEAANLLVENVFEQVDSKVIIAGKSPHSSLVSAVKKKGGVELISNPDQQEMERLITNARCHVFYTNQNTGIKLKLVHAIQTSGHIVMNLEMLFDDSYINEVELANSWEEMISAINSCVKSEIPKQRDGMRSLFNNENNAMQILKLAELG